jgi:uncharacterized protein (DUF427 family)
VAKAVWKGVVLAESDHTIVIERNHYFPSDSVRFEYLKPSESHTVCPWKGTASYHDVEVNGERNRDAAWFYADPKAEAREIKNHIAFWKGVRVES